jgi:selenocysteine lyase/cysteine desulfurase
VLGVAGLCAGIKWVQERGLESIHRHEVDLVEHFWQRMEQTGVYRIFGHRDHARRVGTISVATDALPAPDLGAILDSEFDIAIRPGLHCAPYIHLNLGTFPDGTIRVSPGPFTTREEIDRLADALSEIVGA